MKPDLLGEVARLSERMYRHEQERLNHEALIATQSDRLSHIEKQLDMISDVLLKLAELRGRAGRA